MNHPNGGRNHPKDPCHWDEIIPIDRGWLPHLEEAWHESIGKIEAVIFVDTTFGGYAVFIEDLYWTYWGHLLVLLLHVTGVRHIGGPFICRHLEGVANVF